uniref:BspA family leucine-rich repeat surface protein n=1 Tax=Enterococcus sp. ZJ1668 TaxID=2709402 RepID=UPI0013E9B009
QKLAEAEKSITFEKGEKFIQWKPEATYNTLLAKANGTYEAEVGYQSKDWLFSKNGNIITLEDYVGSSQDVVIPTATDLEYNGLQVQISSEVLKDAAVNARSLKTSENGDKIVVSSRSLGNVFDGKKTLEEVSLKNLDTSNVEDMTMMFSGCDQMKKLDVSNFNVSKSTQMGGMFQGCSSLTSLDLKNWDVSNVTNVSYMFNYCVQITSLDLSNWKLSKIKTIRQMFYSNKKTPLLIKTTDEKLKNYDYAFDNRTKFGTLKIDSKAGNFNGQATRSLFDYTIDQDLTETLINQKLAEAEKSITFEKGEKFIQWKPEATYNTLLAKANGTYEAEVDKTSISLKNTSTTKYIGDIYEEAELRANIASLTDIEGVDVLAQDRDKVTITAKNQSNQSVKLSDLTKTIGNYVITYSYGSEKVEENLSVKDSYYMIIPKGYSFNDSLTNQKLNGTIKMMSMSNPAKEYSGDRTVKMTISSTKNFLFDNGAEYKLTSEGKDLAKKDSVAEFQLGKGYAYSKEVNAQLIKKGNKQIAVDNLIFCWK